jgi:hypothetical protein
MRTAVDREAPTVATMPGLELPLQQVQQQYNKAIDQLALFAASHAFDLFRDILDIRIRELAGAQQGRLFVAQA